MITKEKLKVYEKYKGQNDMFFRLHLFKPRRMQESDFFKIQNMLQEARLVNRKLASEEYSSRVKQKLIEVCDSQETIDYLNLLANQTSF
ncbi:MAG TPA: hypothetical protein PLP23_10875 [Panacibacter sp.]|nr:hypothetical protein [Panacibacter sp.]